MTVARVLPTALIALVLAVSQPLAGWAQSYDGGGIVKFGAFGQGASVNFGQSLPTSGSGTASGLTGGMSVSYDLGPKGYWLVGVELDGSFGDARTTFNGTNYGMDYLVSARGRFGLYPHQDWLVYGTLGFGFLGFEAQTAVGGAKGVETVTGIMAGVGTEVDWHHVILFGEYLYGGFGDREFTLSAGRTKVDADAHLLRVGLKFKVGHDHAHSFGTYYDPSK